MATSKVNYNNGSLQDGKATSQDTHMDQVSPSIRVRVEKQVAVVTGGTKGIGAGIVRRFIEEGAREAQ